MNLRLAIVMTLVMGCGDDGNSKMDAAPMPHDTGCVPGTATATLYLNFTGGTFDTATAGGDDAVFNRANPIDVSRTLAAWPHANAADIKACVVAALRPFKIDVTDVDPSPNPHHEVVMTTDYWANNPNLRTISSSNCNSVIRNSVSFVFASASGTDTQITCNDVLAQFAVASAGLDFVRQCGDYMASAAFPGCGPDKTWTTTPAECGGGTAHPCACGGTFQISMKKMLDKFGPSCL